MITVNGKLNYVTSNSEKVSRLKEAMSRYGIKDVQIEQVKMDLPEPRSGDMGFIARAKAQFAFSKLYLPVLVHDAGFFIHSLNGFPEGFVNFVLDKIKLEGILRLVEGKLRECEFRDCLTYYDGARYKQFQTVSKGTLAQEIRGAECTWPLHRIFIPNGETKTLAEMSDSERDVWRARREDDYYANQFAKLLAGSK